MNPVMRFVRENWERLELDRYGPAKQLSYVLVTPQFRTSRNVIFLILREQSAEPILVAKQSRLPDNPDFLSREAENLQAIQSSHAGGFDSVPRVIACEFSARYPFLIESALIGQTLGPALLRRQDESFLDTVVRWIIDLHGSTSGQNAQDASWFQRLVQSPLAQLERSFPAAVAERSLISRTLELVHSIQEKAFPLVFEHGDLSSPNLLLLKNGGIGVVDWELANPGGLPAIDLFFFLTYAAFARNRARSRGVYLQAFREAFFGPKAWARPYIARYVRALRLPQDIVKPLFLLCWSRYVANFPQRVGAEEYSESTENSTAFAWLTQNRYCALWRHTVEALDQLHLVN